MKTSLAGWFRVVACLLLVSPLGVARGAEPVKIGLNYPKTGPYFQQGLDQLRAALLATDEINAAGASWGARSSSSYRDSQSNPEISKRNALELIEQHDAKMIFGGASTGVALAVGEVAQQKGVPFFATLTYGQATTGAGGHRFVFRECYDSTFGANITGRYLNKHFKGKKYFYITSDYSWGNHDRGDLPEGDRDRGRDRSTRASRRLSRSRTTRCSGR